MQEIVIHQQESVHVSQVDMVLIVQVSISSKLRQYRNNITSPKNLIPTEFDCPGDGDCSNQGTCDESSGTCVCNEGFEGDMCEGEIK